MKDGFQALMKAAGSSPDVVLAVAMAAIVGGMIIPLPPWLLDAGIALNLAAAATILVGAVYAKDALKVAAFPTLLMLTTLFRLALNVSSTRLALVDGHAGDIIQAFGEFVIRGEYVVGAVIFTILSIVQFLVVAKGAERVAEVSARFTLDAMPGKQMSIDADLRSGSIDQAGARKRRRELERESQMFGAMDGAMKFIKGDVIAGLIIVLVNLFGGIVIGALQHGMSLAEAASTYALIAIGDGLVSQIPSLCISIAAGLVVTRVASELEDGSLGEEIGSQFLGQSRPLWVVAGMCLAVGLMPGMPHLVFFGLSGLIALGALVDPEVLYGSRAGGDPDRRVDLPDPTQPGRRGVTDHARSGRGPPSIGRRGRRALHNARTHPGAGADLLRARGEGSRNPGQDPRAVAARRDLCHLLGRGSLRSRPGAARSPLRAPAAGGLRLSRRRRGACPGALDGRSGRARAALREEKLDAAGVPVRRARELLSDYLVAVLRRRAPDFLGVQEVQALLEGVEQQAPVLVKEVLSRIPPPLLADVLKRLVQEQVSIRNIRAILEALVHPATQGDAGALAERCRQALYRYLSHKYAPTGPLYAWLADPDVEQSVREDGAGMDPDRVGAILEGVRRIAAHGRAVVLASPDVRRSLRKLVEGAFPEVAILSCAELDPELQIRPMGRLAAAARR